jgi:hypothetical protein
LHDRVLVSKPLAGLCSQPLPGLNAQPLAELGAQTLEGDRVPGYKPLQGPDGYSLCLLALRGGPTFYREFISLYNSGYRTGVFE